MGRVSDQAITATEARDPMRPWAPSAFTRLARTHAASVAGDAVFTAAMAGTVFFSANSLDEARSRVALTLLFTIAPFAVAAPLIGPLVDRAKGGRRWMIIVIAALRALVCLLLVRHYDTWLLYPEGLLMLVLSKGHLIARGAIVPTVVHSDDELVRANAKLTLLSGITTAVAIVPAGILLKLGGPGWVLGLGVIAFAACTTLAFDLPKTRVAAEPAGEEERAELRGIGILLAASAMGLIRGIVGFLAFLVAFYAKDHDLPVLLGVGAVAGQVGFLLGAVIAPALRRQLVEERILTVCLGLIMGTALLMAPLLGGGASTAQIAVALGMMSLVVGMSSNVAKQAFDAIVQRDAPDANRGRSFARFETRFQLVWVIGALVPTALGLPLQAALLLVAGVAGFALLSYLVGWHRAERGLDHRIIRIRRRVEADAGDDGTETGDAPPDDDATVVMAVPARRARRRRPSPPDPTESSPAAPGAPAAVAPVALLGMEDPDPTLGLDVAPTTGLFAPPTRPEPDAVVVRPGPPPVGYEAGGGGGAPVLFDGAASLEEDHPTPTATGAGGSVAGPLAGDLDVEPAWGVAVAPPATPVDQLPLPQGAAPDPEVEAACGGIGPGAAVAGPVGAGRPETNASPAPPPTSSLTTPGPPSVVARPDEAEHVDVPAEPRWRDVTTPHLPGFEPGVLEASDAQRSGRPGGPSPA